MVSIESLASRRDSIAVVGLGYVGLPLAIHLARHFEVVGYDLKQERIVELQAGRDRTLEVDDAQLQAAGIQFTAAPEDLARCRLLVVAVPTPIDGHRIPDLTPLRGAARTVGAHLRPGSCIVFESTVFPGATEDICVPIMEAESGLVCGQDFTVGYSPERINPGDKVHTVDKIVKVVAGSDEATTRLLAAVYGRVVSAGIHEAPSIKVAEAAKVIENTQRDINIALMNELAMIFDLMQIDTLEVLAAAGTKWNFLNFRPGLVGGHCIGVDPYYLTFKAEAIGYHPNMILAGRRINDNVGKYVAEKTVKMLIKGKRQVRGAIVAVLGLTFKENVPDLRNRVHDSLADAEEARRYYGIELFDWDQLGTVDAIILTVLHDDYRHRGLTAMQARLHPEYPLLLDVKGAFQPEEAAALGITYWRL